MPPKSKLSVSSKVLGERFSGLTNNSSGDVPEYPPGFKPAEEKNSRTSSSPRKKKKIKNPKAILNATILSEEKQSTDPEDLELFKKYLLKTKYTFQLLNKKLNSYSLDYNNTPLNSNEKPEKRKSIITHLNFADKLLEKESFLSKVTKYPKFKSNEITKLKLLSIFKRYQKTQLFELQKKIKKIFNLFKNNHSHLTAEELVERCRYLSILIDVFIQTMRTVIEKSNLNNNKFFDYNLTKNERMMDLLNTSPKNKSKSQSRSQRGGSYKSKFNKKKIMKKTSTMKRKMKKKRTMKKKGKMTTKSKKN